MTSNNTTVQDILTYIESLAPLDTQESWDNSGIQFGTNLNKVCKSVLLSLNSRLNLYNYLNTNSKIYDLIITHHPLFFHPIKNIVSVDYKLLTLFLQRTDLFYSTHTPLDFALNNKELIIKLFKPNTYTYISKDTHFIIRLNKSNDLNTLLETISQNFKIDKYIDSKKIIKNILVISGAGFSQNLTNIISQYNIDLIISSDLKHHFAEDLALLTISAIDITHELSEFVGIKALYKKLRFKFPDVSFELVDKKLPWSYYHNKDSKH